MVDTPSTESLLLAVSPYSKLSLWKRKRSYTAESLDRRVSNHSLQILHHTISTSALSSAARLNRTSSLRRFSSTDNFSSSTASDTHVRPTQSKPGFNATTLSSEFAISGSLMRDNGMNTGNTAQLAFSIKGPETAKISTEITSTVLSLPSSLPSPATSFQSLPIEPCRSPISLSSLVDAYFSSECSSPDIDLVEDSAPTSAISDISSYEVQKTDQPSASAMDTTEYYPSKASVIRRQSLPFHKASSFGTSKPRTVPAALRALDTPESSLSSPSTSIASDLSTISPQIAWIGASPKSVNSSAFPSPSEIEHAHPPSARLALSKRASCPHPGIPSPANSALLDCEPPHQTRTATASTKHRADFAAEQHSHESDFTKSESLNSSRPTPYKTEKRKKRKKRKSNNFPLLPNYYTTSTTTPLLHSFSPSHEAYSTATTCSSSSSSSTPTAVPTFPTRPLESGNYRVLDDNNLKPPAPSLDSARDPREQLLESDFCPYCEIFHTISYCPATPSGPCYLDSAPLYNRRLSLDLELSLFRRPNPSTTSRRPLSRYSVSTPLAAVNKPLPPLPPSSPGASIVSLRAINKNSATTTKAQRRLSAPVCSLLQNIHHIDTDSVPATVTVNVGTTGALALPNMSLLKSHRQISGASSHQNLIMNAPSAAPSNSSLNKAPKRPHFFRRLFGGGGGASTPPVTTTSVPARSKTSTINMKGPSEPGLKPVPVSSTKSNQSVASTASKSSISQSKVSLNYSAPMFCL